MQIVSVTNIDEKELDCFINESESSYFVHSRTWIDLIKQFRKEVKELSFCVYENSKIVAFVPLLKGEIIGSPRRYEFSMFALPLPYPVFSNNLPISFKEKLEKYIFNNIFELAKVESIDYINFYVSALTKDILNNEQKYNPLVKFSFHDVSLTTNIINLEKDINLLMKNFRKGTKSDIKLAEKKGFEVKIYNSTNIKKELFERYKNIHFIAAGRKTRSDETWDIMYQWIVDDLSILALTKFEDQYISGQIINTFNKKAYYQSSAILPDYSREKGLGHLAQKEIIRYLKSSMFDYYELGWNWYTNISQEVADSKMIGISRFKSGFGSDIYPLFRGEWFKDREYYKEVMINRMDSYFD